MQTDFEVAVPMLATSMELTDEYVFGSFSPEEITLA